MSIAIMCDGVQGQSYSDPGATAYDAVDGAITNITVTGVSAIDTMAVSPVPTVHSPVAFQQAVQASCLETSVRMCTGMMYFGYLSEAMCSAILGIAPLCRICCTESSLRIVGGFHMSAEGPLCLAQCALLRKCNGAAWDTYKLHKATRISIWHSYAVCFRFQRPRASNPKLQQNLSKMS